MHTWVKLSKVSWLAVLVLVLVLGTGSRALATSITINNWSFESPVYSEGGWGETFTDWTKTGTHGGVYHPLSSDFPGGVPQGSNVAWVNYQSTLASISQVTGATILADQIYTLQVYVGTHKPDDGATYTVALVDNNTSTILASTSGNPPPYQAFGQVTVTYQSPHSGGVTGDVLKVVLSSGGTNVSKSLQTDFDAVTLSYTAIPLPSTMLLLGSGLVGLGLLRRKWSLKK